MFKMGCTMGRKILGKGSSSSATADGGTGTGAGASSSSAATFTDSNNNTNKKSSKEGGTKQEELNDFTKLEEDPRLPLNVRQIFKITKSWKAIARTMSKTGTAMFLNLFEQNQDLFYLFDRFQHLKGKELHESMELREHAATVMSTLDQSINSLSDYDNFIIYLHSIGKLHRKVPGFKREHFWKIEQPFLKAVKQTLDERCNETIEEIYRIAIKLIIETITEGYGEDRPDVDVVVGDKTSGADGNGNGNGNGGASSTGGPPTNEQNGNASSRSGDKSGGGQSGGVENRGIGGDINNNNMTTMMNSKGYGSNGNRTKQQNSDWAKLQLLLLQANSTGGNKKMKNSRAQVDQDEDEDEEEEEEQQQRVSAITNRLGEKSNNSKKPIVCSSTLMNETATQSSKQEISRCPLIQMRNIKEQDKEQENKQRQTFIHDDDDDDDENRKTNKNNNEKDNKIYDKYIDSDQNNDQEEEEQQQQQQQEEIDEDKLKSTIMCLKELLLLAVKGVSEQQKQLEKQRDVVVGCESSSSGSNVAVELDEDEEEETKKNQSDEEGEREEKSGDGDGDGDGGNGSVKLPLRDLQQQASEWDLKKEVPLIGCCSNANNNDKLNAYTNAANEGRVTKEEQERRAIARGKRRKGRGRRRRQEGGGGGRQVCMFKRALLFVGLDRLFIIHRQQERTMPNNIKGCLSSVELSLSANESDRKRTKTRSSIEKLEKTRRCHVCTNDDRTNVGYKGQFNDNYTNGYAECKQQQQQQQQDSSQGNRREVSYLIERRDSSNRRELPLSDVVVGDGDGDERKETLAMNRDHNEKNDNVSESSCKAAAIVGADLLCLTGSNVSEVPIGAASENIDSSFNLDSCYHRELSSHNSGANARSYYVKGTTTITNDDISSSSSCSQNSTGQQQKRHHHQPNVMALKTSDQEEQNSRSTGVDDDVGDKRSTEMLETANNRKISSNSLELTTLRPLYSMIVDKRNVGYSRCPLEFPDNLHYSPSTSCNETNSYHRSEQQQLRSFDHDNDVVDVDVDVSCVGHEHRPATTATNTKFGLITSESMKFPADINSNSSGPDYHNNDWNNLNSNELNDHQNCGANGHETNIPNVKAFIEQPASIEESHCVGGQNQNGNNNYLLSCPSQSQSLHPHSIELNSSGIKQSSSSVSVSVSVVTKSKIRRKGRGMVRMLLSRAHKLDCYAKSIIGARGNNAGSSRSNNSGGIMIVNVAAATHEKGNEMRQAKVNENRDLVNGSHKCNHQKQPVSLKAKTTSASVSAFASGEDSSFRHEQSQFAMSGYHSCNRHHQNQNRHQHQDHESSCSNCPLQTSTMMTTPSTTTTIRPTAREKEKEKEQNKQDMIGFRSKMMRQTRARLTNNPADLGELIKMLMFTLLASTSRTNSISVPAQLAK